jgi:hypothetical protein
MPEVLPEPPRRQPERLLIGAGLLFVLLPALGLCLTYPFEVTWADYIAGWRGHARALGHGTSRHDIYAVLIVIGLSLIAFGWFGRWKK